MNKVDKIFDLNLVLFFAILRKIIKKANSLLMKVSGAVRRVTASHSLCRLKVYELRLYLPQYTVMYASVLVGMLSSILFNRLFISSR